MPNNSNFDFLAEHDPVFLQLAVAAEKTFSSDPNTTLIKLRQLGEALAQDLASRAGIFFDENTTQADLLWKLNREICLDSTIRDLFHTHRIEGNKATHQFQTQLDEIEIPVAPLIEQKQIVAKLDDLLAQVDTIKSRLDAIPVVLKRFRQSILAAAVTGRLTEEWRGRGEYKQTKYGRDIPEAWCPCLIDEIAEVKGGKRLPEGEQLVSDNTGYPYIRAGQLKDGSVNPYGQLYLTKDVQAKISRYIVNIGDVYITIVGACIGDAGLIPAEYEGVTLTKNAAKLCLFKQPISSEFLSAWLRSQCLQDIIQHEVMPGAQGKLALKRIKTLPFPFADLDEQTEIVRKTEQLFTFADHVEQRAKTPKPASTSSPSQSSPRPSVAKSPPSGASRTPISSAEKTRPRPYWNASRPKRTRLNPIKGSQENAA